MPDEGVKWYIDTTRSYRRRQAAIKYRLVLRAYYDGYPYTQNPEDPEETTGTWRQELLGGGPYVQDDRPDRADGIDYLSNLARAKIDNIIAGILPEDTRLTLKVPSTEGGGPAEVPEPVREELFRRLLYFGRRFDTGNPETDFFAWLDQVLVDVAKAGDGLVQVGSTEAAEEEPGRIKFTYYNYETWAPELNKHDEPVFYRVEWKYVDIDGTEKWYRRDYFPDRKVVYRDAPVDVAKQTDASPAARQTTALDATAALMPRKMIIETVTDEDGVLSDLRDFCVVEVIWKAADIGEYRGRPEITIEDLPAIDADNQVLNSHVAGTMYSGNPPLNFIDLEMPKGEDGKTRLVSAAEYAAGACNNLYSSTEEHQGKAAYPENLPVALPHAETRKEVKATMMGAVPDIRPDIDGMKELSRLSGYAYQTILKPFNKIITKHRQYTIGKVLKALRLGIKLLRIHGWLPAGLPEGVDIDISYGKSTLTEDELLKQATRIVAYWKMGVPAEVLVQLIPLPPELVLQTIRAVTERQDLEEESLLADIEQALAPEVPDGTDNKLK